MYNKYVMNMKNYIKGTFYRIIYILSIAMLKIFTKEEINMIPYGAKLLIFLEKIKIY